MTKSRNHDLPLKLRFRRLLFCQGYWTPLEVELSHYENLGTTLKRSSLTDLDVLGIRFDPLFMQQRIVGDCKTGKNVSDVSRLFWLRGVMTYFGADVGYFLRPKIDQHAKAIAPKMGLRVLTDSELTEQELRLHVDRLDLPLADEETYATVAALWGIDVPKTTKPTASQLRLKRVYSYLTYSYWYIERHRNLLSLVDSFESVADILEPANPRDVLLAYVGAERFGHCLLEVLSQIQAQGGSEVSRYTRVYIYGGPLQLKDREKMFESLQKLTGLTEAFDPSWMNDVIELLGRCIKNPVAACDVLRHLAAMYMACVVQGRTKLPELTLGSEATAAIVLAKDVVHTFAKATGVSRTLFNAVDSL